MKDAHKVNAIHISNEKYIVTFLYFQHFYRLNTSASPPQLKSHLPRAGKASNNKKKNKTKNKTKNKNKTKQKKKPTNKKNTCCKRASCSLADVAKEGRTPSLVQNKEVYCRCLEPYIPTQHYSFLAQPRLVTCKGQAPCGCLGLAQVIVDLYLSSAIQRPSLSHIKPPRRGQRSAPAFSRALGYLEPLIFKIDSNFQKTPILCPLVLENNHTATYSWHFEYMHLKIRL